MNRLRTTTLAALLGAFTLGAPAVVFFNSAPAARAAEDKKGDHKKGEDTELQKQMEVIDESMKKLRKTLRKSEENAESLKTIADLKKACVACKEQTPAMASTIPEAERARFVEN